MLKLNIKRLIVMRGITSPMVSFRKMGIEHSMASKILNGNVAGLKTKTMEKICLWLKCTPNELYEWVPDAGEESDKDLPIAGLIRTEESDLKKTMERFTTAELEGVLKELGKK